MFGLICTDNLTRLWKLQSLGSLPARLATLVQSTEVAMSLMPSRSVNSYESSDDEGMVPRNSASPQKPATSAEQFSFDQDDAVTLHVGPTEHVLLAHGSFITRNSDFFTTALKKEWAEGQTRVIKLPEESPQVVSHYLNYTYTKSLPADTISSEPTDTFTERVNEYQELLAELYVLGERLLDTSIQNAVVREIIRLASLPKRMCPAKEAVNIIYRGTTAVSPARRLMTDIELSFGTIHSLEITCEAAFVLDVARAFCARSQIGHKPDSFRNRTLNAGAYGA